MSEDEKDELEEYLELVDDSMTGMTKIAELVNVTISKIEKRYLSVTEEVLDVTIDKETRETIHLKLLDKIADDIYTILEHLAQGAKEEEDYEKLAMILELRTVLFHTLRKAFHTLRKANIDVENKETNECMYKGG